MVTLLVAIVAQIGTGIGVYAGIRADLARLHERVSTAVSSADKAHSRIDNLLNREKP